MKLDLLYEAAYDEGRLGKWLAGAGLSAALATGAIVGSGSGSKDKGPEQKQAAARVEKSQVVDQGRSSFGDYTIQVNERGVVVMIKGEISPQKKKAFGSWARMKLQQQGFDTGGSDGFGTKEVKGHTGFFIVNPK